MVNPSSCQIWGLGALNHSFCTFEHGPEVPETGLEVDFQKSFWLRSRFPFWSRFPGSISISISTSVVDLGFDLDFSFASASISVSISVSGFDLNFDFIFVLGSTAISISVLAKPRSTSLNELIRSKIFLR